MPNPSDPDALLEYPFADRLPAPATLMPVADGVWWLRMPLPFALDHINLWLLRDNDEWAVVDTGFGDETTRALWRDLLGAPMADRPLARVIVTHHHPDHIGNAAWLARAVGCRVWATEGEFLAAHAVWNRLAGWSGEGVGEFFRSHGLGEDQVQAIAGRRNGYRIGAPELPNRIVRMFEGDEIVIGAHRWRVIVTHGHAPEHACLYCESLGVLIAGDQLLPRISTNVSVWPTEPEGDPLARFLRSFGRFRELPPDTLVLPSHGRPFRGIETRLAQLDAHHAERLEALEGACEQPRAAAEVLDVLFRRQLDTHQLFFAMGEAVAHLNHLMHRGRLRREQGKDGVLRFRQQ